MAARQDREYVIPGPTGGVNTRVHPTLVPDDNFVMLKNLELATNLGAFKNRAGTTAYNSTLLGASAIRGGIRWYYGSGSKQLIVGSGSDLWLGTDGPNTFASIKSGLTADRDYFLGSYLDYLYIVNGIDAMQRWDGTTMRAAGFPAPGSTCTVATGAATGLTGTFKYKVTFLYDSNDARESSASAASASVTVADQKIAVSAIPTGGASSGVTARNLYRTKAGGSDYFFLTKINDNSTTTYTDSTADGSLGTNQAPTDNGVPPAGQYILIFKGRMFVANTVAQPQRLYMSSITSTEKSPTGVTSVHGAGVEIFPASHFVDVGDNNRPITGLGLVRDQVVVFKEDAIYNVLGDDAQDMVVWAPETSTGCISAKTIANIRGNLFFLGRANGVPEVFAYDGARVESVSIPIEPTLLANVGLNAASFPYLPCATSYRGQYVLAYGKDLEPLKYECAVLDTRPPTPRWMFWDKIEANCFIPWNNSVDAGEMYYGSQEEGRVLKLDFGATDYATPLGTAIATTIQTKWLDLGMPNSWKQIRRVEVYAKSATGTTITVERRYDFNTSGTTAGASAITMNPSVTGHSIFKMVVDCGGSDATTPEQGYLLQLVITGSGPIEIYKIVVSFTADPVGNRHDGF